MYRSEDKDFFDVPANNRDQYFMIYTNSTLIDPDTARKMAEAGNVTPAISVEGWEADTDVRRGKGVFAKSRQAMENLKKAGVPFGISVTATRQNAETVLSDDFLDYYFEKMGAIYGWIFQYMPIGRSYTLDMMVTPEQRRWMLEKEMEMIWEKNRFLVDFWNGGIMSVGCISVGHPGGCFYIDRDGNIAPCVFFPYKAGNVYQLYDSGGDLNSVLSGDYFQAIRSWQDDYVQTSGEVKNLFVPCPIRDHYEFAHQTVTGHHAPPMDNDAGKALADSEYRHRMVKYGNQVKDLLDPLWKREIYPDG